MIRPSWWLPGVRVVRPSGTHALRLVVGDLWVHEPRDTGLRRVIRRLRLDALTPTEPPSIASTVEMVRENAAPWLGQERADELAEDLRTTLERLASEPARKRP